MDRELTRHPGFFLLPLALLAFSASIADAEIPSINESYGKLPLYFIKNDGQVDAKVKYYEKGSGHATYFTGEGVYLSLVRNDAPGHDNPRSPIPSLRSPKASESIRLSFINANENPEIIALDEQAGKVNYFIGNDPSMWRTNIPTYSSVLYREVWPGIDIKFYGNNQQLEYDVIIKPGADPDVVKFSYEGIEGLKVAGNGDLEVLLDQGAIVQKKPYIYQEIDGKKIEVAGSFIISAISSPQSPVLNSYSFSIASYDTTRNLVIDPGLAYSTFLGGTSADEGNDIAVDSSGSAYVTGFTFSSNFPIANAFDGTLNGGDAFVTKLNPSGTALSYSTFLGGSNGDSGFAIAVDSSGNAYVTGHTFSSDFPTTASAFDTTFNGGSYDAFVTKLNPSGSALAYSTFLGGMGRDEGHGIVVDSLGKAYVTGYAESSDFPTTASAFDRTWNGSYDVFITNLSAWGSSLVYSTFLGGANRDEGHGIAVDSLGNAYVAGGTSSSDFPTASAFDTTFNGWDDAFVAKLSSSGSALVYSTYLGGTSGDRAYGIAVDSSGNAYVAGITDSPDFPTTASAFDGTHNGHTDAFVAKLNAYGSALSYSTFLGGSWWDYGYGIAIDSLGSAYVTGDTGSSEFPVTASAFDGTWNGNYDAFVTNLDPSGSALEYSTFLGGTRDEWGNAIALDSSGKAYVIGVTDSSNFPATASAFDTTFNGGYTDVFVTKISPPRIYEETDTAITYTGTWTSYACAACSSGAVKYSGKTSATATFSFTGKGVKWIAAKANQLGKAKVYVDGVLKTTVDLYSATNKFQQVVYQKTWTSSGSHTIVIEVAGKKNASSKGYYVDVDAFEVAP